jgi:hypothetical protein
MAGIGGFYPPQNSLPAEPATGVIPLETRLLSEHDHFSTERGNFMPASIKRSVDLSPKTYEALQKVAAVQHRPVSEIIRKYIEQGLNVDKTASDIDFIRKQIREELDIMIKPQVNRLAKLQMRVGMMTVSFCYFTSKIVHMFMPLEDRVSYEELMAECKHNAAAYLNMRDASLDAAFRVFDENNP